MSLDLSPGWLRFADLLDPPENPHVHDLVSWSKDVLDVELWSLQADIGQSVDEFKRTTVQAGHGVGKTLVAAVMVLWWVSVHPVDEVLAITTAPTDDQVKTVLWREVMKLHENAGLPGRVTLDAKWHIGSKLVAFGRKPSEHRSSALQGHHERYLLTIVDEAAGVPFAIWDQLASLTSNENGRQLAIGNPTDPSSHFAKICAPGSGWARHKISVLDSPNFTGEKVSEAARSRLSDASYVEQAKKDYGVGSPLYAARVLGEFPEISDDTLITPKWIEAAQRRSLPRDNMPHVGIDIARFGEDESVIMRREGGWARVHEAFSKSDTMATTGRVVKARNDINSERQLEAWVELVVDEVGVGAGVFDRLRELDVDVVGFNGGEAPYDRDRFINRRAEVLWTLREMFEREEIDIDPYDDQLAAQLGSIKWNLDSRGRIKIESKDDMRKRGMPSPDRVDALCMTLLAGAGMVYIDEEQPKTITGDVLTMRW